MDKIQPSLATFYFFLSNELNKFLELKKATQSSNLIFNSLNWLLSS